MQNNTALEVCLQRYLKFLGHLDFYKEEPRELDYAKHLVKDFLNFCYHRDHRLAHHISEFLVKEYDMHLSSLVEEELETEIFPSGREPALRERVSDFLRWCFEESLLKEDHSHIIE